MESHLTVSNDAKEPFTEEEISLQTNQDEISHLDPADSILFLERQLPDYFISFSTILSKEDYDHYKQQHDINGILTVWICYSEYI